MASLLGGLESRIDGLGRDLRAELHDGFAQVDNRLQLLQRHRP